MKRTLSLLRTLTLLLAVTWLTPSLAQISIGGTPPSFEYETGGQVTSRSAMNLPIDFDVEAMRTEDVQREATGMPPRVGRIIPVHNLTTVNSGEWTTLPNGQHVWRLSLMAKDAIAIMLTYDKFEIPTGGQLFIYNDDRSRVLGAYTEANNPKRVEYATEFIPGDRITLEYVAPMLEDNFESPIILTGVVYGYNHLYSENSQYDGSTRIQFNASGACNVNVKCDEGNDWQDDKQGVVRIVTSTGGNYYALCTGALVNNTARNLDPLFLSAWHCYNSLTPAQINQSVYYFKYEHPTCTGRSDPSVPTVVGATVLVSIPLNGASDGMLLRLNEGDIEWYKNNGIYFNGWDSRNVAATSGVGIHHPKGDIKKISTFTSPPASTQVYITNYGQTATGSNWRPTFVATDNGYGITEQGSSGSPLFDQNHRIIGTLTGGSGDCSYPAYNMSYYGKLWWHFDQSSNTQQRMKPYLDPINSGELFIDGTYDEGDKIRVTADNKEMREGDVVPPLTATITGPLLPGDTYADVVSSTLTCDASQASVAGTYIIKAQANSLKPNYLVEAVDGVLTITPCPTEISRQPEMTESSICTGSSYTFTVTGTGLDLKYQWQRRINNNWQDIPGANEQTYTIAGITAADAGWYRVKLTGRTAEATSREVELKFGVPQNIVVYKWHDVPIVNCNKETNGGYTFVAFQWYENGAAVSGATKPYIQAEIGAIYNCEMKTEDDRTFRLCDDIRIYPNSTALTVYPNPTSAGEGLVVRLADAPQGAVVNIFSLNGGLVKSNILMQDSEARININGLVSGMYVLQVVCPDGVKHTTNIVVK